MLGQVQVNKYRLISVDMDDKGNIYLEDGCWDRKFTSFKISSKKRIKKGDEE